MAGKAIDSNASAGLVLIFPIAFAFGILFVAWPVLLALILVGAILRVWQHYQWQQWSQQVNPFFHKLLQENQGCVTALDLAMKANISGSAAQRYLATKAEEFGAQRRDYEDQASAYYFITSSTLGSIFDESTPPSLEESEASSNQVRTLEQNTSPSVQESKTYSTPARTLEQSTPPSTEQKEPSSTLGRLFYESEPARVDEMEYSTDDETEEGEDESASDEQQNEQSQQTELATIQKPDKKFLIQSELARRLEVHSSTIHKRRFEPYFAEWSRSRDPEGIAWKYSAKRKLFSPIE